MFKNFLLVAVIFLMSVADMAYAHEVSIYDYSVEQMIQSTAEDAKELGFGIWGKEYYTYKGERYCKVYFGDSKDNCIYFKPNGNEVQKMWICVSANGNNSTWAEATKAGTQAGAILSMTLDHIGLTRDEQNNFWKKYNNDWYDAINQNPPPKNYSKEYLVGCSATARIICLNVKIDNSGFTLHIYAKSLSN